MSNAQTMLPFQASNKHIYCARKPTQQAIAGQNPPTPSAPSECMMISEKEFLRSHTMYSAISSWLFAIAGATNIGVLCAFSSKVLTAVEQGKPLLKSNDPAIKPVMGNRKYNRIALAMMAFGGVCMGISNWLESKKVVTEWQLGAGKLQRKVNIAEKERAQTTPSGQISADAPAAMASAADAPAAAQSKNWAASLQPKIPDAIGAASLR